jgi:hypothetical protein
MTPSKAFVKRPVNGECYTQIESMAAYPQQIVTTRLLYCLQDRIEQLSRMQRIYPHAW